MLRKIFNVYMAKVEIKDTIFDSTGQVVKFFNTNSQAEHFINRTKQENLRKSVSGKSEPKYAMTDDNKTYLVSNEQLLPDSKDIYVSPEIKKLNLCIVEIYKNSYTSSSSSYDDIGPSMTTYSYSLSAVDKHSRKMSALVIDGMLYQPRIINEPITIDTEYGETLSFEDFVASKQTAHK